MTTFRSILTIILLSLWLKAWAEGADNITNPDSSQMSMELKEVVVKAATGLRAQSAISNTEIDRLHHHSHQRIESYHVSNPWWRFGCYFYGILRGG